jgi:hypothetical protein
MVGFQNQLDQAKSLPFSATAGSSKRTVTSSFDFDFDPSRRPRP